MKLTCSGRKYQETVIPCCPFFDLYIMIFSSIPRSKIEEES